jgi:hypothetical protein
MYPLFPLKYGIELPEDLSHDLLGSKQRNALGDYDLRLEYKKSPQYRLLIEPSPPSARLNLVSSEWKYKL